MNFIGYALIAVLSIGVAVVEASPQPLSQVMAGSPAIPNDPQARIQLAGQTHDHAHQHPSAAYGTAKAVLETEPQALRAGEPAVLTLKLFDGSGQPIENLINHHARKLHVVIISDDMLVFGHIHPHDFGKPIEAGEAKVAFIFPHAGRYLVAADFMTEEGPNAAQFIVEVAGSPERAGTVAGTGAPPSIRLVELEEGDKYTRPVLLQGTGKVNGYTVSLQRPNRIEAGAAVTLVYRFTRGGAPVTDLRPFLDAPLHLVVVRDDLRFFLHGHGMPPGGAHAGHADSGSGRHGHASREHERPSAFGPVITANFSFPKPGTYYVFGQAAHGDKLLILRYPIEVH